MYAPEKVIKRTLPVSLLLHGILFLVLENKFQGLNTIEPVSLPDIMVSLIVKGDPPPVAPSVEMSKPEPLPLKKEEIKTPVETVAAPALEEAGEPSAPVVAEAATLKPDTPAEPIYSGTQLDPLNLEGARMPAPSYPSQAKRMEWEGDVTVSFVINCKGRVESVKLENSSGYEILDEMVIRTVSRAWRFPKRDDSAHVWKTFSFRLIS